MRSTRRTSSYQLSERSLGKQQWFTYLQGSRRLESERRYFVTSTIADVNVQHIAPAVIKNLNNRDRMFLQSRVGKLLHSLVGAVACVVDCSRDVLYVVVDLLLFGWCGVRTGANEVDKWLNALYQEGSLVFKVVLGDCQVCSDQTSN